MDGVLCDFIAQSKKAKEVKSLHKIRRKNTGEIIKRTPRFWSDMPWMPRGKQLWNYIKQYNPHIYLLTHLKILTAYQVRELG